MHREQPAEEFDRRGVLHDLPTAVRIAGWAYRQTFEAGGLTWAKKEEMVNLQRTHRMTRWDYAIRLFKV